MLAKRSRHWALVRSLTHPSNDHTVGHYFMLTGRSVISPGFLGDRMPRPSDWPSIASIVGDAVPARGDHLPPAVVLPERLVHWSGGVIPGAYGGLMGARRDPWFIEASPYGNPFWRGAYPEYTFANETKKPPPSADERRFQAPSLSLPEGLTPLRLHGRVGLLTHLDEQRRITGSRDRASTVRSAPPGGDLDAGRSQGAARVRRDQCGTFCPGPLRTQLVWLVAAHGLSPGGGGCESGPGQPGQQRDVGHARRRLPAVEEQAVPSDRPVRSRPCSTTCWPPVCSKAH